MTKEEVIRLAREAGFADGVVDIVGAEGFTNFAALVEQHLRYDSIHTCHDQCTRPACVAVREAVLAEREACAQVCDRMRPTYRAYDHRYFDAATDCAATIRSRGEMK